MLRRIALLLVMMMATSGIAGAQQSSTCDLTLWPVSPVPEPGPDPRIQRHVVDGFEVNVLLPTEYLKAGDSRRYPVLYVLHGAAWGTNDGANTYLAFTDIEALSDQDDVIVVFPYGGWYGWYTDWNDGAQKWESYHLKRIVSFVESSFRTIANRSHRAVAGESMGGFGAMLYAARHPDLFVAAGSFSGHTDIIGVPLIQSTYWGMILANVACFRGPPVGPWGNPVTNELGWRNHNPTDLARNLGGIALYVGGGNGVPCEPADDVSQFPTIYPLIEPSIPAQAKNFSQALNAAGVPHRLDLRNCGMHSWPYFQQYLHEFWPQMTAAFGAAAPAVFDFRSADPRFSAWGWSFEADPGRGPEFLDVTDASAAGVMLTGSGVETVTTATYFAPESTVTLANAVEPSVTADSDGRITFHVDLGPAHTNEQYTIPARGLEALGDYWTTRTVTFNPVP